MDSDIEYFNDVICRGFAAVDWDDVLDIKLKTAPFLREIAARKSLLRALVTSIYACETKMQMSDQEYGVIKKFMLHQNANDRFRLRLHIIEKSDNELPHNHGMSFATLLLYGEYEHILYSGLEDETLLAEANTVKPLYQGREVAGEHYAIHHSLIHEARACYDDCITLMVRGPRQKECAVNIDSKNNRSWWQKSTADLATNSHAMMNRHDIDQLVLLLEEKELI